MAGKLIITRGLPGSGKSTWAAAYAEEAAQRDEAVRIVTMDDIRAAIGAIFEAGDESIVQSVRDFTIREYLKMGYTVISADTNLNGSVLMRLYNIASRVTAFLELDTPIPVFEQDFTDVPLQVCLNRNQVRWNNGDRKVPNEAIESMYNRFLKTS